MSQTTDALDALQTRFGIVEAIEMLEYARPFVSQWEQQLRETILAGDRENAAHYAHKAIGSVRLYGSPELETLLYRVKNADSEMYNENMQQTLFAEFAAVQRSVNSWVKEHRAL